MCKESCYSKNSLIWHLLIQIFEQFKATFTAPLTSHRYLCITPLAKLHANHSCYGLIWTECHLLHKNVGWRSESLPPRDHRHCCEKPHSELCVTSCEQAWMLTGLKWASSGACLHGVELTSQMLQLRVYLENVWKKSFYFRKTAFSSLLMEWIIENSSIHALSEMAQCSEIWLI